MTDIEEKIAKAEEEIRQLQNRKRKLRKRQILMRLDTKLPQPFASWSNSL